VRRIPARLAIPDDLRCTDRDARPPLLPELLEAAEDLPPPKEFDPAATAQNPEDDKPVAVAGASSEAGKKLPKWLNKTIGKSACLSLLELVPYLLPQSKWAANFSRSPISLAL
jgi:hypothetical protein